MGGKPTQTSPGSERNSPPNSPVLASVLGRTERELRGHVKRFLKIPPPFRSLCPPLLLLLSVLQDHSRPSRKAPGFEREGKLRVRAHARARRARALTCAHVCTRVCGKDCDQVREEDQEPSQNCFLISPMERLLWSCQPQSAWRGHGQLSWTVTLRCGPGSADPVLCARCKWKQL